MKKNLFVSACCIIISAASCSSPSDGITDSDNLSVPDNDLIQNDDYVPDDSIEKDNENTPDNISGDNDTVPDENITDNETTDENTVPDESETPDENIDGSLLYIEQIYFPGTGMGEAILIIGPDGTSVLIDTANDGMSKQTEDAISRRTGNKGLDWVIITHYHNDHIGGFDNLFSSSESGIAINKGLVVRGMLDIGSDMPGVEDFNEFCTLMAGELSSKVIDLCEGGEMPCGGGSGGPWGASGCNGLLKGDLSDTSDDAQNITSFIPLGGGARIYFTHANGWIARNDGPVKAENNGINIGWGNTDEENARSLGAVLKWGKFNYVFAGDTQGRDIKIEKFIADNSAYILAQNGEPLIKATGADVVHLSHHGLASSTSQEWVNFLFPDDGKSRNAVVGTSGIYVTSPAQSVLDSLAPRLGTGMVWANAKALTSGKSYKLFVADTAVTIHVENGGSQYRVVTGIAPNEFSSDPFMSVSE